MCTYLSSWLHITMVWWVSIFKLTRIIRNSIKYLYSIIFFLRRCSTCPKCRKYCNRRLLELIHLDFTETQNESQTDHSRDRKQKNNRETNNGNVNMPSSSSRSEPNPEPNSSRNILIRLRKVIRFVGHPIVLALILTISLLITDSILTHINEIVQCLVLLRIILLIGIFVCILRIFSSR